MGGGMSNSFSLLELFRFLEQELDIQMRYEKLPWRSSDQKIFVAHTAKAKALMNWQPEVNREAGVRKMIEWVRSQ
jgi:CDP-paratose 2-epimerase